MKNLRIISAVGVILSLLLTACGNPSYKYIKVFNARTNATIYEYEGKASLMEGEDWLYIVRYDDGEKQDRIRLNANVSYVVKEGGGNEGN